MAPASSLESYFLMQLANVHKEKLQKRNSKWMTLFTFYLDNVILSLIELIEVSGKGSSFPTKRKDKPVLEILGGSRTTQICRETE